MPCVFPRFPSEGGRESGSTADIFISRVSETLTDGSCMVRVTTGYHDLNPTQGSSTHQTVLAYGFSSSDVPGSR